LEKGCLFAQGKARSEKKNVFSCIIKTKWCSTSEILRGVKAVREEERRGGRHDV